jgi:tetracycline resistance efflux pump
MPIELWLSLIPSLAAIVLAIWTKQVIPSLLIGLWTGSLLLTQSLFGSIGRTIDYIVGVLSDEGNLYVLLFLYIFSGLVALIQLSGGVQAFTRLADKYINSAKKTLFALWGLLPITFIDCGFRVVAGGSIIKSLAKKYSVSRERLAYMLNNSASPVIVLIPFATTFVAYIVGVLNKGMEAAGAEGSALQLFISSIPFQFFSFTSILIALLSLIPAVNIGTMKDLINKTNQKMNPEPTPAHDVEFAEENENPEKAKTVEDQTGTAMREKEHEKEMSMNHDQIEPVLNPRIMNLVVPLALLIPLSFYLMWGSDNQSRSMLIALLTAAVATVTLYLFQGLKLKRMVDGFFKGGNKLIVTIAILTVAWPISDVSQDLGMTQLIQTTLGGVLYPTLVPVLSFVVTGAVAYFIGSSWGSWALMMPIAIPLAVITGGSLPMAAAAVLSGGTFGDVTSPVSGMTAMSAGIAEADHMKYVKAMTPYNMTAGVVAAGLFLGVPFLL